MSFYIGNQTAFFTKDPQEPFKYALAHSFTAFEWFNDKKITQNDVSSGWGYSDVTEAVAEELKDIGAVKNIRYSIHASCNASALTHDGMKDIFAAVKLADKIGAKLVNIHLDATSGIKEFVQALIPVIIAANVRNILLAVENTPLHSPEQFNEFFTELDKLDIENTQNVGMCLDIGHANCCAATRNDYIGFIDRLNKNVRIIHGHIHENWGDADTHLPLFTASSAENDSGIRMMLERLKERDFSGSLIMEQWPDDHNVLDRIFVRLSDMLGIELPAGRLDSLAVSSPSLDTDANIKDEAAPALEADSAPEMEQVSGSSAQSSKQAAGASESWAIKEIIEFSRSSKSWRRRLEAVKELFFDERRLGLADLAAIAVYLRFLSTAEIPCVEDGGHYRPCHHAKAALEIEEAVSKVEDAANAWIVRRIYPYLPSHAEEFMRHEPLTRIRDIAHRNDIPKEIKLDIKHNLQNKLHRSAGPEDLLTAERILGIITAEGADYSADFVREFRLFYEELKEFFNAVGLEKRLLQIKEEFSVLAEVIEVFVQTRDSGDPVAKAAAALLVREGFHALLREKNNEALTRLRLADIEIEDYAFATISEGVNGLKLTSRIDEVCFKLITVALKHIQLSEFKVRESGCLSAEFEAWKGEILNENNRLSRLRLWASVQRGLRFCSSYADIVNEVFSAAVLEFGKAFKIPRHAVEVYCEGDIRANIIFQLSRILGAVQRVLRSELDFAPWSVINGGKVRGEVVVASDLKEFEGRQGEFIVLLEHAQGDEEIPAAVRAILLAHPIAHLSHLGVRSRSGKVPFATAEDIATFNSFKEFVGRKKAFCFGEDGVGTCEDFTADEENLSSPEIEVPEVMLSDEIAVLGAEDITRDCCGAKAGAAAELYLAAAEFGCFVAPKVMAIPYGVMELCFEESEELYDAYDSLVEKLAEIELDSLDGHLKAIADLIYKLSIPNEILVDIAEFFGDTVGLAIRSSSSGEDLAGFAGAGLYDSVIGVGLDDLEEAIKQVWASKWTRRAVLSREKYGVDHADVYMGILIQEIVDAEYSFVLHTANPVTGMSDEVGMELAVGFGETLASGNQSGSPCRIKYICESNEIHVERCADLSEALVRSQDGRGLVAVPVDYSKFELFLGNKLEDIAKVLYAIGLQLETHFGAAQDVEGAYAAGVYYVVQSRPQAGVDRG